jgi:DNA helicase IV
MDEDEDQLNAEQQHLDETYEAYDTALKLLRARSRTSGIDEFANEALERMREERIRVYAAASGPLYFGRIDDAEGSALYVGRHAVSDKTDRLLAINWRAPSAEPFYTATPQDPKGMSRRRRLDIEERRVLGFVDEELRTGGEGHLTEAIIEDITRQRVGEMRQIISTITPEQYELISEEAPGALVIQGGPGTGKTAVGLHRAAWLLYTNPELGRQGVLVIGPNDTFIRYISQVLPALGEGGVEQRPIGALISRAHRETAESHELAALKGSARMAPLLQRLLWDRVVLPSEDFEIQIGRSAVTVSGAEIRELVLATRERTRSYQAGRERFREQLAGLIASRATDAGRAVHLAQDEVLAAVRKVTGYQRLASKVWPRESAEGLYARLFKNRRRLTGVAGDLLTGEEIATLLGAPKAEKRRDMTPTDVALLDEAHWLVDPDVRRYGHVVIDEAQNLTPMELRMAVRRARGQSLTVLGDLAQRTADAGVSAWNEVLAEAGVTDSAIHELNVSYRVPADFLELAAPLVPSGSGGPRGVRTAPWPAVVVEVGEGVASIAVALARRMATDAGSVGLVVPDRWMEEVRAVLDPGEFADATRGPLGSGINLLDLHVAKGLEFDAVVIVEPAAIYEQRPDGGAGGLYTALTRSTRALAIVHADALPAGLGAAPALERIAEGDAPDRWASLRRPAAVPAARW